MRVERYTKRTISSYLYWVKYFILFHDKPPSKLGNADIHPVQQRGLYACIQTRCKWHWQ